MFAAPLSMFLAEKHSVQFSSARHTRTAPLDPPDSPPSFLQTEIPTTYSEFLFRLSWPMTDLSCRCRCLFYTSGLPEIWRGGDSSRHSQTSSERRWYSFDELEVCLGLLAYCLSSASQKLSAPQGAHFLHCTGVRFPRCLTPQERPAADSAVIYNAFILKKALSFCRRPQLWRDLCRAARAHLPWELWVSIRLLLQN